MDDQQRPIALDYVANADAVYKAEPPDNLQADGMIAEALKLAEAGANVFPLHSITNGKCDCGDLECKSPGKHPRTRHGVKNATTEAERIKKWWTKYPQANIAIATGTNMRVLDIDPRNGGDKTLADLEAKHGPLPRTMKAKTGGSGEHYFFLVPLGFEMKSPGTGIDVKGGGGYVVAAPSLHQSGKRYQWEVAPWDTNPAEAPHWLLRATTNVAEPGPGEIDARKALIDSLPPSVRKAIDKRDNGKDRSSHVFHTIQMLMGLPRGLSDAEINLILTGAPAAEKYPGTRLEEEIRRQRDKWLTEGFKLDDRGKTIPNSQHNIKSALRRLGVTVRYDLLQDSALVEGLEGVGPRLDDAGTDRLWLTIDHQFRFRPTREFFLHVLLDLARKYSFHPVRDYLSGLKWDGVKRLDNWLSTYGGAPDNELTRAVGKLLLVAGVRRVRQPGCKFDEMVVLVSPEGKNKSSALAVMAVHDDWFNDDLPLNADSKRMMEALEGKWLHEAGELTGMSKADVEGLNSFMSRRYDEARMSYDRLKSRRPRQCIIIGTTNSQKFLRRQTGLRRFWPVAIEEFDLEALKRDRDQLWAEAAACEVRGDSIRLDPSLYEAATAEQEARRIEDPFEQVLLEHLGDRYGKIKSTDIWEIVGIPVDRRTQEHNVRLGNALQRLGWEHTKRRFSGTGPINTYVRGEKWQQHSAITVYRDSDKQLLISGGLDKEEKPDGQPSH